MSATWAFGGWPAKTVLTDSRRPPLFAALYGQIRPAQLLGHRSLGGWRRDHGEAAGVSEAAVRIEPLTEADVGSAVRLAVRVLGVKPGDRGEQFAADITGERRQMFVARASGQVVGYGRVLE